MGRLAVVGRIVGHACEASRKILARARKYRMSVTLLKLSRAITLTMANSMPFTVST